MKKLLVVGVVLFLFCFSGLAFALGDNIHGGQGGDAEATAVAVAGAIAVNGNIFVPTNEIEIKNQNVNRNDLININNITYRPCTQQEQAQIQSQHMQQGQKQGMLNNFNWKQTISNPRQYVAPVQPGVPQAAYPDAWSPFEVRFPDITERFPVGITPFKQAPVSDAEWLYVNAGTKFLGIWLDANNMWDFQNKLVEQADKFKSMYQINDLRLRITVIPKNSTLPIFGSGGIASAFEPTKTASGSAGASAGNSWDSSIVLVEIMKVKGATQIVRTKKAPSADGDIIVKAVSADGKHRLVEYPN